MFEFLKKILHKPNPALPEALRGLPVRELDQMHEILGDLVENRVAYVALRPDSVVPQDTPPWMYQDSFAGYL